MKLFMEQNTFVWGEPLTLWDRNGHARYTLTGEAYSLGKRLHVRDLAGREAVTVRQKVPSMLPRYEIEVYGRPVGGIVKDLTFLRPRYTVEQLGWEVSGSLGQRDYALTWQNSVVAESRPTQGENGPLFTMAFYDRTAELSALGVLLTINCALAPQESKRPG